MPDLRKTEIRWVKTLEKGSAWRLQTEERGFSLVNFLKSALEWNNHYRNQQQAQQIIFPSSFSVHWAGNTFLKWSLNGLVVARGHWSYCFGHVWLGLLFPLFFLDGLTGLFCKIRPLRPSRGGLGSTAHCLSVWTSLLEDFALWKAYQ